MRRNHTVNIVFNGNMAELEDFLRSKGLEFDFIPPGLVNSASVIEIKNEETENDSRSTNSDATEI